MKNLILSLVVALMGLTFVAPAAVNASTDPFGEICTRDQAANSAVCNETSTGDPIAGSDGVIVDVVRIIAFVAGVAAVVVIIISGIKFITASGDSNGINSAKQTILYALIGLIVIILGQAIITFVITRV